MLNEEDVILIGLAVAALPRKKTLKRKRGKWVKDWLDRPKYSHVNLLAELRLQPDD
jgi:hypothetical protein